MKKIKYLTLIVVGAVFTGCGGGSGSTSTNIDKSVTGSVEASYLKNVKICVKDSEICTLTDSQGRFKLPVEYPVSVDLYIGENKLGSVAITSKNYKVTPSVLAEGNVTLAGYIGAFLHYASGSSLDALVCDMNNVKNLELNSSGNTLIEKLKNYSYKNGNLAFKANNKEVNITLKDLDYYVTTNPTKSGLELNYNGAVTIGDYANFKLDYRNKKVKYKFRGKYLDNLSNEDDIINLYNNMFYISSKGNSFYFITRGVMVSKIVNSLGDFDIVSIPKNYRNISIDDVASKYNVFVKDFNIDGHKYSGFVLIKLEKDNTYQLYLKQINNEDIIKIQGEWKLDNNKIVLLKDGKNFVNVSIKVGYTRNSIVFDGINGGFGLGVEAIDIDKKDFKRYYYLKVKPINYTNNIKETKVCFGYTQEKQISETKLELTEVDKKCMIVRSYPNRGIMTFEAIPVSKPITIQEEINPIVNVNGTNVKFSGLAVGYNENGEINQVTVLDGDNGFYINTKVDGAIEEGSLGSDRILR